MQLLKLKNKAESAEFTLRVMRAKEAMGIGKWPEIATLDDLQLKILADAVAHQYDYLDTERKRSIARRLGLTDGYLSKKISEMRNNGILKGNYTVPSVLLQLMSRDEWTLQFKLVVEDGTDRS